MKASDQSRAQALNNGCSVLARSAAFRTVYFEVYLEVLLLELFICGSYELGGLIIKCSYKKR